MTSYARYLHFERNLVLSALNVHFLPALIDDADLAGSTAVIIDILRASTTIVAAIHNGATSVIPCPTPDAARRFWTESNGHDVLLGGERGGVRIDGFDCGNSPAEYTAERVRGKIVAFTTTNGTRALLRSAAAETILIGAFTNFKAVVNCLQNESRPIHLVCAGTDGAITGEDVLYAGAVVEALMQFDSKNQERRQRNDCAQIAQTFWQQSVGGCGTRECNELLSERIETVLRSTLGGLNLRSLGYDHDIRLCSLIDTIDRVPFLHHDSGRLN